MDRLLEENPHYYHCRHLGQLAACRVFLLDPAGPDGATCYHDEMLSRGLKLGEIELAPLDAGSGWRARFWGALFPIAPAGIQEDAQAVKIEPWPETRT